MISTREKEIGLKIVRISGKNPTYIVVGFY